ncbi:Uncharacterized protein HZ326_23220 [Fusarium oxysporum f. sp. albedinis]|nr:Uncharacterized protein HZ326_23220 [Fusarium oxysporum f. sp. albedinis]
MLPFKPFIKPFQRYFSFSSCSIKNDQESANFRPREWNDDINTNREAIAYSLKLVAKAQRSKFAELIEKALPEWTSLYKPQEFLDVETHYIFDGANSIEIV